jgi:hypothetical protein
MKDLARVTLEIRFAGEKASCTAVFTIAPIGFVAGWEEGVAYAT